MSIIDKKNNKIIIDGISVDIKYISILCENVKEVRDVADYLHDILNIGVYGYSEVEKNWEKYPFYIWSQHGDYFVQSREKRNNVVKAEFFLKKMNLKKIRKPEIDPYDEEDWGYVEDQNEIITETSTHLKIGDVVIVNGYLDRVIFKNDIGIIREVSRSPSYDWIIEFPEKNDRNLHSCSGIITSGRGFHIRDEMVALYKKGKEVKKIRKPDIDPYDEEDWGYVEEI